MDYTKKLGLKKKTTLQNITRNDAVRLVSLLEKEKAVLAADLGKQEIESAEQQAKICAAISDATVFNAKIADIEAQLAEKAGGKVPGVFAKGDRVEYIGDSPHVAWVGRRSSLGVVEYVSGESSKVKFECDAVPCFPVVENLRHAAQTCPECAAKQKRVDELAQEVEMHRDRAGDVVSELNSERAHLNDYKTGTTAEIESLQERIEKQVATIENQAAMITEREDILHRKNYTVLQLSDQVAALEMGD